MTSDLVPARAAPPPAAWTAADHAVSEEAAAMVRDAPSERTRRAYGRWIDHFRAWCATQARCPLPATEATLVEYVRTLARVERKGAPTIRIAIAAVRAEHATRGLHDQPPLTLAMLALRTHTRDRVDAGARGKKATPILSGALERMVATCDLDTIRGRRDHLVLTLGWAGFLRRSELAAMLARDVRLTPVGDLAVFIPRSKTDRHARGATVDIPRSEKRPAIDPVRSYLAYRDALTVRGVVGGHLLREVTSGDRVKDALGGDAINDIVRRAARLAELDAWQGYSAHSLRSGGATSAYLAGKPVSTIAAHGRWAPNSPVVLGYIRAVDAWRDNAMRDVS